MVFLYKNVGVSVGMKAHFGKLFKNILKPYVSIIGTEARQKWKNF